MAESGPETGFPESVLFLRCHIRRRDRLAAVRPADASSGCCLPVLRGGLSCRCVFPASCALPPLRCGGQADTLCPTLSCCARCPLEGLLLGDRRRRRRAFRWKSTVRRLPRHGSGRLVRLRFRMCGPARARARSAVPRAGAAPRSESRTGQLCPDRRRKRLRGRVRQRRSTGAVRAPISGPTAPSGAPACRARMVLPLAVQSKPPVPELPAPWLPVRRAGRRGPVMADGTGKQARVLLLLRVPVLLPVLATSSGMPVAGAPVSRGGALVRPQVRLPGHLQASSPNSCSLPVLEPETRRGILPRGR